MSKAALAKIMEGLTEAAALVETVKTTHDMVLHGKGYLRISPDGTLTHIPFSAVYIEPKED